MFPNNSTGANWILREAANSMDWTFINLCEDEQQNLLLGISLSLTERCN
jgi:hypothetical protein